MRVDKRRTCTYVFNSALGGMTLLSLLPYDSNGRPALPSLVRKPTRWPWSLTCHIHTAPGCRLERYVSDSVPCLGRHRFVMYSAHMHFYAAIIIIHRAIVAVS